MADPARRASATTIANSGSANNLATTPCVPKTKAAASVTKFPVTCAVKSPCRPRKPAVSTKPPLKLSKAGTASSVILDNPGLPIIVPLRGQIIFAVIPGRVALTRDVRRPGMTLI
jgi:hypothetical protein